MARIRLALYLGSEQHKLGPGKVRLLEAIRDEGSISQAARSMGMAYRHAWEMVDDLNRCFAKPVVEASIGGQDGGGAALTPWGEELIERFHAIAARAETALRTDVDALERRTAKRRRGGSPRRRSR